MSGSLQKSQGFFQRRNPKERQHFITCWVPSSYEKKNNEPDEEEEEQSRTRRTVELPFACDAVHDRQAAWLQGSKTQSWRPTKWYRVAAKHWCIAADNQIKNMTSFNGLSSFQLQNILEKNLGWRQWPTLGISIDLGSDGLCASFFLMFKLKLNMFLLPDESHAIKNSFLEFLKSIGAYDLVLLLLVVLNYEMGPRKSEERRHEARKRLTEVYHNRRARDTPLFLAGLERMVVELETYGGITFPRTRALEDEVWDYAKERNQTGAMNRRRSMARYGDPLRASMALRAHWTLMLWERQFCAIETDILAGKFVTTLRLREDEKLADGTTGAQGGQEQAIKRCGGSALLMSVLTLREDHHRRLVDMYTAIAEPRSQFHSDQNKAQRSAEGCSSWMQKMAKGGFVSHLNDICFQLKSTRVLRLAGFSVPSHNVPEASRVARNSQGSILEQ